jgi:uncharacterized cupin superfamily protein
MNAQLRVAMAILLMGAAMLVSASATQVQHPIALSASDPTVLTGPDVKTDVIAGRVSRNRVMGLSADEAFSSGLYSADAGAGTIESYPVDEFMYFVSGDMVMTSVDGAVVRLKPGDAVHVPRGWQGTWRTAGYTKFYVVYDVGKR